MASSHSVIIDDLHIRRSIGVPTKADPELIVKHDSFSPNFSRCHEQVHCKFYAGFACARVEVFTIPPLNETKLQDRRHATGEECLRMAPDEVEQACLALVAP